MTSSSLMRSGSDWPMQRQGTAHVGRLFGPIMLVWFVVIALLGGAKAEVNLNEILRRRLTVTGSTLRPRPIEFKAKIAAQLKERVWPHLEDGTIKPVIYKVFPAAEAAQAHELMESSTHVGKIVLNWGAGA